MSRDECIEFVKNCKTARFQHTLSKEQINGARELTSFDTLIFSIGIGYVS